MKINQPPPIYITVDFSSTLVGDCFLIDCEPYMRINDNDSNCVSLRSGRGYDISDNIKVVPIVAELSYKFVDSATK